MHREKPANSIKTQCTKELQIILKCMKNSSASLVTKEMPIKLTKMTKNNSPPCCKVYQEGSLSLSYCWEGRFMFFWEGNINLNLKGVQVQTSCSKRQRFESTPNFRGHKCKIVWRLWEIKLENLPSHSHPWTADLSVWVAFNWQWEALEVCNQVVR